MSQRRMFSPDIVGSEEFLTMPVSSRELYFQLGMNADDDGFVQPKLIMRMTGANEDDLKVLLAKRFLLQFNSGVVVIKHWLIHNMIRGDRYKATRFDIEKNTLRIKENKAYTEIDKSGCQSDNQMAPQVRLSKDRLSKVIHSLADKSADEETIEKQDNPVNRIITLFKDINPMINYGNKTQRKATEELIKAFGLDKLEAMIDTYKKGMADRFCPVATTPLDFKNRIGDIKAHFDKLKAAGPRFVDLDNL